MGRPRRVTMFHFRTDPWAKEYEVREFTILSGPDEQGRFKVKEKGRTYVEELHGDWLFTTPALAVKNAIRRSVEHHQRELMALQTFLKGVE
jgi:hypothetical protein